MSDYTKTNKVTHAGVEVSNWSGDWSCSVCKRKRLIAAEFSKKMQEKRHKDPSAPLKCKECVEKAQKAEQEAAASSSSLKKDEFHICSACKKSLNVSNFTTAQLKKGPEKQRCSQCITRATQEEAKVSESRKAQAIIDAKKAVKDAEASGSVADQLKANAKLAALEGELVTGIRPKAARGRSGRGRARR